jgi:ribose transport system substrate-binding protein
LTTKFLTGRPAALGICALALMLIAGCNGKSDDKTKLAFVTNNASDYWTICHKGTDAAAKELGNVDVQFIMPSDGTAATQK